MDGVVLVRHCADDYDMQFLITVFLRLLQGSWPRKISAVMIGQASNASAALLRPLREALTLVAGLPWGRISARERHIMYLPYYVSRCTAGNAHENRDVNETWLVLKGVEV
jgi:hypothetical protein